MWLNQEEKVSRAALYCLNRDYVYNCVVCTKYESIHAYRKTRDDTDYDLRNWYLNKEEALV